MDASEALITDAIAALRRGELVVYPTETFYGIAADPFSEEALERLFELKGRDAQKAVAMIAGDAASAFELASKVDEIAFRLARRFWPGPLTLVLPARIGLAAGLVGPGGGVGVRVSPHPIARALATGFGHPITATSANLSGEPPSATVEDARRSLGAKVSVYIDGGKLGATAPSTLVECARGEFRILRAGAISEAEIASAARENQP